MKHHHPVLLAAMAAMVPFSMGLHRQEERQRVLTVHDLERIEKAKRKRERKAAR